MTAMFRVSTIIGTAALLTALALPQAHAQAYPNRPVKMIVTVQAGSGSDNLARYFANLLSQTSNERFYVENRPGAGGNIGMSIAEKSAPDGYTVSFSGFGTSIINAYVYTNLGWDPKNFDPILLVAKLPFVIAVNPKTSINSLTDLVAQSKAKPGTINIAVTSTTSRLVYEMLKKATGLMLYPVSYGTPAPAMLDGIEGRVSVVMETISALRTHTASGRLKPIAITNLKSGALVPGVRSVGEQGFPAFGEVSRWTSLIAPRGTPNEAITWINREMNKILLLPETKTRLTELGAEPGSGTPQELAAFVAGERERWGPIIKEAGIKAE